MEWIKVSNRLPKRNKNVLVLCKNGEVEIKHLPTKRKDYCWGWYPDGLPIENTTHWMEIPKLPETINENK